MNCESEILRNTIKYMSKSNTVNNMKLMILTKIRVICIGMFLQLTFSECLFAYLVSCPPYFCLISSITCYQGKIIWRERHLCFTTTKAHPKTKFWEETLITFFLILGLQDFFLDNWWTDANAIMPVHWSIETYQK